jgi:hypothetical protein
MRIDLTPGDAKVLQQLLTEQLNKLETELVHTDKRELQREIAGEAARIRGLIGRLGLDQGGAAPRVT